MAENKITDNVFGKLNELLNNVDLTNVSADDVERKELPCGYYLSEVESAILRENKSGEYPQVMLTMKIVEDGIDVEMSENNVTLKPLDKTTGRKTWIFYTFKDEDSIKRFVRDMLKFEGEKEGEPILPKEAFLNGETLEGALEVITGMRIYINISEGSKPNADGTLPRFANIVSWKRAKMLELPL